MTRPIDPVLQGWDHDYHEGYVEFFGPIWVRQEGDRRVFGLLAEDRHADASGFVSNGVLTAFADHAVGSSGIAVFNVSQVTIELTTRFIERARPGDFIEASAVVAARSENLIFLHGTLTVGDCPIALAEGIWKSVRPLESGRAAQKRSDRRQEDMAEEK